MTVTEILQTAIDEGLLETVRPVVCDCGTGPNVAECKAGHFERTNAKASTRCPHREGDGPRCAQVAHVRSPRRLRQLIGPAAEPEDSLWPGEAPPAEWRDALGAETTEQPCDDCGCDGPPVRWTSDHTATVCPQCGPEFCWSTSAALATRLREHAEAKARKPRRTASVALPQREIDRQERELNQRKQTALAMIRSVLADQHLTESCRTDFMWFGKKIAALDVSKPGTEARLAELEDQLGEQRVDRGFWRRSFAGVLEWLGDDQDDDDDDEIYEGEIVDDDDEQPTALESPRGLRLADSTGLVTSRSDEIAITRRPATSGEDTDPRPDWVPRELTPPRHLTPAETTAGREPVRRTPEQMVARADAVRQEAVAECMQIAALTNQAMRQGRQPPSFDEMTGYAFESPERPASRLGGRFGRKAIAAQPVSLAQFDRAATMAARRQGMEEERRAASRARSRAGRKAG